jgi:hypothetical protein
MDIEQKINMIFYLLIAFLALFCISLFVNLRRSLFTKVLARHGRRIDNWDSKGEHAAILDVVDGYIAKYPGEATLVWAKARALFKLGRLTEARTLFIEIADSEPIWKEDAKKYIDSINEKTSV